MVLFTEAEKLIWQEIRDCQRTNGAILEMLALLLARQQGLEAGIAVLERALIPPEDRREHLARRTDYAAKFDVEYRRLWTEALDRVDARFDAPPPWQEATPPPAPDKS